MHLFRGTKTHLNSKPNKTTFAPFDQNRILYLLVGHPVYPRYNILNNCIQNSNNKNYFYFRKLESHEKLNNEISQI